jgi:hypothetical protein
VDGKTVEELREFFVKSFSSDPNILAFTTHFCNDLLSDNRTLGANVPSGSISEFSTAVLFECLSEDKPEAMGIYLEIYRNIKQLWQTASTSFIWNMEIIFAFYKSVKRAECKANWLSSKENKSLHDWMNIKSPLLNEIFIGTAYRKLTEFFDNLIFETELHHSQRMLTQKRHSSISGGTQFVVAPNIDSESNVMNLNEWWGPNRLRTERTIPFATLRQQLTTGERKLMDFAISKREWDLLGACSVFQENRLQQPKTQPRKSCIDVKLLESILTKMGNAKVAEYVGRMTTSSKEHR